MTMPAPCKKWPNSEPDAGQLPHVESRHQGHAHGEHEIAAEHAEELAAEAGRIIHLFIDFNPRGPRRAPIPSQTCPTNANRNGSSSADGGLRVGRLAGSGQLTSDRFEHYAVVGELSLEGARSAHQRSPVDPLHHFRG